VETPKKAGLKGGSGRKGRTQPRGKPFLDRKKKKENGIFLEKNQEENNYSDIEKEIS